MDKNFYNLLNEDEFGLLDQIQASKSITENDRVIESFLEVVDFYNQHNKLPELNDVHERKLAVRLKTFQENIETYAFLKKYDTCNILKTASMPEQKTEDEFGLLSLSEDDYAISKMINVPAREVVNKADFVAKRTSVKDFSPFEKIFENIKTKISNGNVFYKSEISREDVTVGTFFVLNGVIGYVASIDNLQKNEQRKFNARTRIVFDNETESNILFRTLIDSIHKDDGKVITLYDIESTDSESGYIYILKSLSSDPKIQNIKNLYKIGFSTTPVEERIKNADTDPTYLMAPVHLIEKIQCFNLDPHRFERLIHIFFSEVCLDLQIADNLGKLYTPKEWFSVPLNIIEEAVDLIISGDIINYEYDKFERVIKKKQ